MITRILKDPKGSYLHSCNIQKFIQGQDVTVQVIPQEGTPKTRFYNKNIRRYGHICMSNSFQVGKEKFTSSTKRTND